MVTAAFEEDFSVLPAKKKWGKSVRHRVMMAVTFSIFKWIDR